MMRLKSDLGSRLHAVDGTLDPSRPSGKPRCSAVLAALVTRPRLGDAIRASAVTPDAIRKSSMWTRGRFPRRVAAVAFLCHRARRFGKAGSACAVRRVARSTPAWVPTTSATAPVPSRAMRTSNVDRATGRSATRIVAGPRRGSRFRRDVDSPRGRGRRSRLIEGGGTERGGVFCRMWRATAARRRRHGPTAVARGKHGRIAVLIRASVRAHRALNVGCSSRTPAGGGGDDVWWFGGGMDLTPITASEDAVHFHRSCRDALAPFGADVHGRYKRWCDEYFYLKHRGEPRGIGGIFFDDLADGDFERCFALTKSVGDRFLDAYVPILERRKAIAYGERERDFQAYRRGRYVEFNLVFDRGTLFGLQSNGRTEAILMSLPPIVKWRYDWKPAPGSPEARLYSDFLVAKDWLAELPAA